MSYSEYQYKKAKKIIDKAGIAKIEDNVYQVISGTNPNDSYIVDNGVCSCQATRFGRQCTHMLVVEMFNGKD